jgi:hypothetical protein
LSHLTYMGTSLPAWPPSILEDTTNHLGLRGLPNAEHETALVP